MVFEAESIFGAMVIRVPKDAFSKGINIRQGERLLFPGVLEKHKPDQTAGQ
jgi:hypothetical protein